MIQNFAQWNKNSITHLNEGASSAGSKTLRILSQKTGKTIDEIVEGGFKGIGNLISKFFGASSDEIAKMEKGFSKIVEVHKEPWWQSMSRSSRRNLEKEADEIGKKFIIGYHRGDDAMIQAARKESKEYLSKVRTLGSSQKVIDDLTSRIDDVPRGKVRVQVTDDIKAAQKNLDDAIKSGDADKIKAARMYTKKADETFTSAGKRSSFYEKDPYYRSGGGRNGVLGRGMEDGSDLKNIVPEELEKNGKEGFFKKITRDIFKQGKDNFEEIPKKGKSPKIEININQKGGLWEGLKRNIRRFVVFSAVVAVGGIVLNFKKSEDQTKAANSFEEGLETIKKQLFKEGVSETEINLNKASFAEIFRLWFSGESGDLPDDAEELKTMFEAGSTMTDFFAKTSQIAFEYPEKYFKDKESDFEKSSLFYGFMKKLNERIGLSKLLKTISEAGGMAEKTIQDTFYVNGSPPSLEEHGYLSYNNPNMKRFLGYSDPIDSSEIIDEAKDFLSIFSSFKRKTTNDFIQSKLASELREDGVITQEEFVERARQIELELSEQLSNKEEVFVAMIAIIMAYNADREPFKFLYGFDTDDLSDTMDAICSLMGNTVSFDSRNQLSRMYMSIASEFFDVYETMGKERSFYGIMEYSKYGVVMRSMMNLLALETICRMIVESSEGEFKEEYSKSEVEEYQKVIIQIQRNEGMSPTVSPSGELDTETEAAIREFQNKFGLPETGKPGDKVLKSMKDYLLSTMTTEKT